MFTARTQVVSARTNVKNIMKETYNLIRLFDTSTEWIIEHFKKLSSRDIYLRFGYYPTEEKITEYITKTLRQDNERENADFWFAIKDGVEIVATLHVAIRGNTAEFGFTVDEAHRGKKLGQLLFARGFQLTSEYSIDEIFLTCLAENAAMRHIARKFGLHMKSHGPDVESTLQVPKGVLTKKYMEAL